MTAEQIKVLQEGLQETFDLLVKKISKIQIGTKNQFPFGWRNAGKGRTVWRIVEEVVTQNLEKYFDVFNLKSISVADSEICIFDFECKLVGNENTAYINIKTAVNGGVSQKDDISKGNGLKAFYEDDNNKTFFVGTFFIDFNDDMTIKIDRAVIFPIAWIKDIYVNPSNNGNLQSQYYKDIKFAVRRSDAEFYPLLLNELEFARLKKGTKPNDEILHPDGKFFLKQKSGRWKESDGNGNLL